MLPRCARAIAMAILLAPAVALADAPSPEADALFEQGRAALDAGHYPEACAKLEKSFQLAPRLGTMLNLGACYEMRGQLAHALAIYERAATLARQTGRTDREHVALDYAAALEAKVGKVLIVAEEKSPELVTQVDGETISTRAGLVPIDPGKRKLVARVPGKLPYETTLDVVAGKNLTVKIPALSMAVPPPSTRAEGSSAKPWLLGTGVGLTVVSAGLGTYFGLRAKSKKDQSGCDASGCTPDGLATYDDARAMGNASTVAFALAGVFLAGTIATALFFPSDRAHAE